MKFDESFHRTFYDCSQFYLQGKGCFFQNFFVIVCDRPDEMYFYIFVVILHDITGEEVFESVQNDSVDTRLFDIFDEERRYRCQKTIGERLLVYVIQNFFWREIEAVEKFFFSSGVSWFFKQSPTNNFPKTAPLPSSPKIYPNGDMLFTISLPS